MKILYQERNYGATAGGIWLHISTDKGPAPKGSVVLPSGSDTTYRDENTTHIQFLMERPQYKGVSGRSEGGYKIWEIPPQTPWFNYQGQLRARNSITQKWYLADSYMCIWFRLAIIPPVAFLIPKEKTGGKSYWLPLLYPNGICGNVTFILRIHGNSQGYGEQHHSLHRGDPRSPAGEIDGSTIK